MLPAHVQEVLDDFVEKQKQRMGVSLQEIILYGSYARGDYSDDSDVDVMILTSESDKNKISQQLQELFDFVFDYQIDQGVELNPNLQNVEFFNKWMAVYPYYTNIRKDGISLYGVQR